MKSPPSVTFTDTPDPGFRIPRKPDLLMNLQVTEKKVDGVERLLQVEVPADMVRQAEEKAVRRYASSARLPGFRPGKAPPAMIRQGFGVAVRQGACAAPSSE